MKLNRRELLLGLAVSSAAQTGPRSGLVYPGADGRLVYTPDELGNTIPDFSQAGYLGGAESTPEVPVKAEVTRRGASRPRLTGFPPIQPAT